MPGLFFVKVLAYWIHVTNILCVAHSPVSTNKKGEPVVKVYTQGTEYRTHSLDKLAHRLYGQRAVVIVKAIDGEMSMGSFAVPDKDDKTMFHSVDEFIAS